MANAILTPTMITRETSMILKNSLFFGSRASRKYDDRFAKAGAKIGSTLDVRIPPKYLASRSEGLVLNDSTETKRTLTIGYAHVGMEFNHTDLLLSINDFKEQFLNSAIATLANLIDLDGCQRYEDVFNLVGTIGGGAPAALTTYQTARAKMIEEAVPQDMSWTMAINAAMEETIINDLRGLFHSGPELANQYKEGQMRRAIGYDWVTDMNMFVHTAGTRDNTTPVTNGANQTGTSLICDGLDAGATIKKGDVFTITGMNAVNPQSRQSTGRLRQFVVTADATADGGGNVTLSIYPAISASGKDQTVTALVGDGVALTFNGAASAAGAQGLAFQKDAFSLTVVDDILPEGVDFASRTSEADAKAWNVSMTIIRDYDINTHKYPCRLGCYYGWLTARPELACRISA